MKRYIFLFAILTQVGQPVFAYNNAEGDDYFWSEQEPANDNFDYGDGYGTRLYYRSPAGLVIELYLRISKNISWIDFAKVRFEQLDDSNSLATTYGTEAIRSFSKTGFMEDSQTYYAIEFDKKVHRSPDLPNQEMRIFVSEDFKDVYLSYGGSIPLRINADLLQRSPEVYYSRMPRYNSGSPIVVLDENEKFPFSPPRSFVADSTERNLKPWNPTQIIAHIENNGQRLTNSGSGADKCRLSLVYNQSFEKD